MGRRWRRPTDPSRSPRRPRARTRETDARDERNSSASPSSQRVASRRTVSDSPATTRLDRRFAQIFARHRSDDVSRVTTAPSIVPRVRSRRVRREWIHRRARGGLSRENVRARRSRRPRRSRRYQTRSNARRDRHRTFVTLVRVSGARGERRADDERDVRARGVRVDLRRAVRRRRRDGGRRFGEDVRGARDGLLRYKR